MHTMLAKDLKYNKSQLLSIDKEIRSILSCIDDDIRDAHDGGKVYIKYSLPSVFSIDNMKSIDSRRKIHSNIISDVVSREFEAQYLKQNNKYFLIVTWVTQEELYKTEREVKILNYYNMPTIDRKGLSKPDITGYKGVKSLT